MAERGDFEGLGPMPVLRAAYIGMGAPPEVAAPLDEEPPAQILVELAALIIAYRDPAPAMSPAAPRTAPARIAAITINSPASANGTRPIPPQPAGWADDRARRRHQAQVDRGKARPLDMAVGQCRIGQDPRAHQPGGAALARRVNPQHILCLTYTKAAASEMQIRLFDRLARWAMLPDRDGSRTRCDAGPRRRDRTPTPCAARAAFRAGDRDAGGLRIQTIHSFCASLLRRFPLEAGVTPQFTEMDDQTARLLRAEIVERSPPGTTPRRSTLSRGTIPARASTR